jgi:hypothetical protein
LLAINSNKQKGGKSMEKEQTQEGAVEEQPKEETSTVVSEAVSIEKKATSEKQKTDDEWKRTMQSRTDKAEHEARVLKETLQSVQTQFQGLRESIERQKKEARKKELDSYKDDPEMQNSIKLKHELEDYELTLQKKWAKAMDLAGKYKLEHVADILSADTPREMELLAELKAKEAKGEIQEPAEQAKLETKASEPPKGFPKPDSGASDASGDSDKAFLERWNAGDIPATKENLARANKIINK